MILLVGGVDNNIVTGSGMTLAMNKVKLWLLLSSFILRDVHSHYLLVFSHKENVIFLRREGHRGDLEVDVRSEGALGV